MTPTVWVGLVVVVLLAFVLFGQERAVAPLISLLYWAGRKAVALWEAAVELGYLVSFPTICTSARREEEKIRHV
jgi:hypothetical protein